MSDTTGDTEIATAPTGADASGRDDTVAASDAPTHDTPAPKIRPSRPSQPASPDYPALQTVDPAHYVITRELAHGGMGRIHLARDRRLGREVAVKELLVQRSAVTRRFEREARITARLQHPSIVSVHEAGVWPSGDPFYAMPVVSGRSLDKAIAAARTFEGRLALLPNVLAVADAMAYAHGQRVIHRDLKPHNVLVGEFGETVVIDWGLAKELDATASSLPEASAAEPTSSDTSSNPGETTAGDVLGTPAYMPPEQAAGELVDERADVYAIGALLYHVLAGEPPYAGSNSAEILAALRTGPPPAIAPRAPNTPGELVAIVERAMTREPAGRYRTARELAEDLRRFQTGQLVGAHRYSLRQLLGRWIRRHRTAIAAVAAAAAVGLAIGVFAVSRIIAANRLADEQRTLAVANEKSAEANRKNAEELMDFMLGDLKTKLQHVGRIDLLDSVASKAAEYYDRRGATGSDDDIYQASVARGTLAQVFQWRGDTKALEQELEKERVLVEGLVARHPDVAKYRIALAGVRYHLADVKVQRGDLPGALAGYRAALPDTERAFAEEPDDDDALHAVIYVHNGIGSVLEQQGDTDGALAEYQRTLALAAHGKGSSRSDEDLVIAHGAIGALLRHARHDYAGALEHYRQTLHIAQQQVDKDPKSLAWLEDLALSHHELAGALTDQGDLPGALAEAQAGLAIAQRLVDLEPTRASYRATLDATHEQLGIVLFEQKDYAGATAHYRAAYDLAAALVAADPGNAGRQHDLAVILNRLGDAQLAAKDLAAALASYRSSLATHASLAAKDPTNATWRRGLFDSHDRLGKALRAMPGHAKEALDELRGAVAIAEDTATHDPTNRAAQTDLAATHEEIGDLLVDLHDLPGARVEYRAGLEIAKRESARPDAAADWAKLVDKLEHELAKVSAASH